MDITAMRVLRQLYDRCEKRKIKLIICKVQKQPRSVMKKAGFIDRIGEENLCEDIDKAIERAKLILTE